MTKTNSMLMRVLNLILTTTLIVFLWQFLRYWSVYTDFLLIIGIIILISYQKDISIPWVRKSIRNSYFKTKFKIFNLANQEKKSKFKLKCYKLKLRFLYDLVLLFKSSHDSFEMLREDIFQSYSELSGDDVFSKRAREIIKDMKTGKGVDSKSMEFLSKQFFEFNHRRQVMTTFLTLLLLILLIIISMIINYYRS